VAVAASGHAGAVTVEGRAYPAEGPLAYGVATAWLRSQPVAARLPRLDWPHLTELARLLPELAAHAPPPEPLPAAELRRRLFAAIARAVLAAGAPLLLIADDVQWADAQSLRLIHYLLRTVPSARLLVAATARREELDEAIRWLTWPPACARSGASPRSGSAGSAATTRRCSPHASPGCRLTRRPRAPLRRQRGQPAVRG
jgi:AAA ATPase domain